MRFDKRKMVSLLCCGLLASMLLQTVGCTGDSPSDVTGEETTAQADVTESQTDAESHSETDTETEADPIPVDELTLRVKSLVLEGGKVKLTLNCELKENAAGNVICTLSDKNGVIAEQTAEAVNDKITFELPCADDRLNGALTVAVNATRADGEPADTLTLYTKNGLVQLSADSIHCVVAAMTLEEKAHMVTGTQNPVLSGASGGTYAIERLGVPSVTVNDGPAGVRYGTAVWYPSVSNLSSSWDPSLAVKIGQAMGEDSLVKGVDVILAPGMNIQKNVLGGRNFEYCSEDPILTAYIASAYTQGIQSTGVGVSIKHFAANNQDTNRGTVSANVTERALREIYLKAFGMVVRDADPYTIMSSYNLVNGTRVACSYDLLTTYLRGERGFTGMVMSDWGSGGTVIEKVNAGNDINMPGFADDASRIVAASQNGMLDMLMLDAACSHVLGLVVKCPAFTQPERESRIDFAGHGDLAAEVAAQTMVLLKNENGTLPMAKKSTLAVFGNGSFATEYGGLGSGQVDAKKTVSIAEGLHTSSAFDVYQYSNHPFKNAAPHDPRNPAADLPVFAASAAKSADNADAAVIVISRSSSEGTDHLDFEGDFRLSATEAEMIERVSAAFHAKGKRVVALINTGIPMEVVSWQDQVDAVLWVGYAGERIGDAVAEVLCGNVNPSAKTTVTWPVDCASTPAGKYFPGDTNDTAYYEDIYVGYRYYSTFGVDVAYPFGHGLSYTTFDYSDFTVEKQADGTLVATCTVRNSGAVAGREVVQVYVTKPETKREHAALELAGFAKTAMLEPGRSETVRIVITEDALETYDTKDSRYVIDGGEYIVSVGASAADVKATRTVTLGDTVLRDVTNIATPDCEFPYIQKDSYEIPSVKPQKENIALGKPTTDNGHENESLASGCVVDGNPGTRWSGYGCTESTHMLTVDLQRVCEIGEISILWESIHMPFVISVSEDGKVYTLMDVYTPDPMLTESTINLYGQTARYIRVTIPKGNFVSIYELAVYAATEEDKAQKPDAGDKVNLALGKTVTSTDCEGSYLAAYAVDGKTETRWGSLPNGKAWLQVDLGEVTHFNELTLMLESAWVPYYIEVSTDGVSYETIHRGQKDELFVVLKDLGQDARYVRVRRDGSNWFSIIELQIFG